MVETPSEADLLGFVARMADAEKLEALSLGLTPEVAMAWTAEQTIEAYSVVGPSGPIAVFGLALPNDLGACAPWMIPSNEAFTMQRDLLLLGRLISEDWCLRYGYLTNVVDSRNVRAVRWLRAIGYTVEPAAPTGPYQRMFHRFWMDPDVLRS